MQLRHLLLLIVASPACDGYDEDLGPAPFLCGPSEPRCPAGYACQEDRATGQEICFGDEGAPSTFDCADDTALEPNEGLDTATPTQIDVMKTYSIDTGAICPIGDSDLYSVNLATAGQNLEILITYDAGAATLRGSILSPAGLAIAGAAPVTGMPQTIEAHARGLAAGKYYARVMGPSTGSPAVNNYKLTINVTGP